MTLACCVLGHRYRFSAQGAMMSWKCQRGGAADGPNAYTSPAARRFAAAFYREDRDDLGRGSP